MAKVLDRPAVAGHAVREDECAVFSEVIGRIYECAIDPSQWNDTLELLVDRLDTPEWTVAMLMESRQGPAGGHFLGVAGLEDVAQEIYLSTFAGRNPWAQRVSPLPLGQVTDTDDLMPRSELLESAFYKDYLSRWNLQRAIAVTLERRPQKVLGFIMPGPPDIDIEELKRGVRLVAPHIQRAVRISHAIGETNLRAQAAEAALDRAPEAVVTLTPALKIVNANSKARALAGSGWVKLNGGSFAFVDAKAQARLIELARARPPASAAFKTAGPDRDELPVLAACLPAQSTPVLGGTIEGAGLLVSIGMGSQETSTMCARLGEWFGLTPAEARLTASLAAGENLKDYAARRAVSMNAVRFLLKGVYRKTGATSQAQLIARVRNLPAN
jgi:DNA-binding CsgD family transcriptional regulator/PAS domain-containing protein